MSPSIPAGSLIFIRPVDPQTVAIGDVITFRPPSNAGVLVTHRVVGYGVEMNQQRSFRTKGDANSSADPDPVAATAVIGRVVYRAPYLGTLVARAHTTTGVALLLVLPLFLALGGRLRRHTIPAPSGARPTTS